MPLIDSHCHLNFPQFQDHLPALLERMAQNGVSHALCVSVDLPSYPDVLALAEKYPHLYASVGVHPDYEDTPEPSLNTLIELAQHPKVIAIGETGLDYYRSADRPYESMTWQRDRFRTHIRAACAVKKPLIVHTRAASEDTLTILREENASECGGVMHCFTESWEVAQAAMALNFYISLSGIVTFKSASDLQAVAQKMPIERLLLETDSPYLAPMPFRGKTNEPAYVKHVAEFIATLRNESFEHIAQKTTENFFNLFKPL